MPAPCRFFSAHYSPIRTSKSTRRASTLKTNSSPRLALILAALHRATEPAGTLTSHPTSWPPPFFILRNKKTTRASIRPFRSLERDAPPSKIRQHLPPPDIGQRK